MTAQRKREDHKILKLISDHGRYPFDPHHLVTLPLLVIPATSNDDDWGKFYFRSEQSDGIWCDVPTMCQFYDEFVALIDIEEYNSKMYLHFNKTSEMQGQMCLYSVTGNDVFYIKRHVLEQDGKICFLGHTDETPMDFIGPVNVNVSEAELHKMINGLSEIAITHLYDFHKFAYEQDKYMVLVESQSSYTPKGRREAKKPWNKTNGSRLIYLNLLPSEKKEPQGGTHASPPFHQKRGHYRTLRAERFKNHPKYLVEKGVYVRPAWAGQRTSVAQGNRYTIITGEQ